jgi:hypothetical protein
MKYVWLRIKTEFRIVAAANMAMPTNAPTSIGCIEVVPCDGLTLISTETSARRKLQQKPPDRLPPPKNLLSTFAKGRINFNMIFRVAEATR